MRLQKCWLIVCFPKYLMRNYFFVLYLINLKGMYIKLNESFYKLSEEKQTKIINAGLKCFGQFDYQKANTAEIAENASISKSLLFYYFKNKKEYFMFLCHFCKNLSEASVDRERENTITDFFEMMDFAIETKLKIMQQYPYFSDFTLKVFYSDNKEMYELKDSIEEIIANSFDTYFKNIDFSKFKEDIEPKEIYRMIMLLAEGYLSEQQRRNCSLNIKEAIFEFEKWKCMLKKLSYKEEYLL